MVWINFNPQAGREMKDIHPLVVLSPRAFNERTGIVIGLPTTTAAFHETNPFAVKFAGPRKQTSYIIPTSQNRSPGGFGMPSPTPGIKFPKMSSREPATR